MVHREATTQTGAAVSAGEAVAGVAAAMPIPVANNKSEE
ncbi:hypothetical protein PAJL_1905 [Cutibacterium acnes HL042PA3]|nr:hypothetical protein HMPREF9949_0226 [Propionibacterium sp. CC003-HC2]ESK58433.1 hypothetical protein PAJL_1905 [Cutibacterium acnes HL042PA3]MCW5107350.1 hypothetical protein [Cutibacterium acnes P07A]MCW5115106.1 hypothetical protein [Cutibacterium acnes P05]